MNQPLPLLEKYTAFSLPVSIFMDHTKTSHTSSIWYKMSFYSLAHILPILYWETNKSLTLKKMREDVEEKNN